MRLVSEGSQKIVVKHVRLKMMTPIEKKRANRFLFLKALYEATDGDPTRYVSMHELGPEIGLTPEETGDAYHFLRQEGLIRQLGAGGSIVIEHEGVRHVENAIAQPERPTQFFPPVNIIHVESMLGSQIVQGSSQTTITNQPVTEASIEDLRNLLAQIRQATIVGDLAKDDRKEIESECATIEAQLTSPRPKRGIIREGLSSLRNILEGAAGNALGSGLVQLITQALGTL